MSKQLQLNIELDNSAFDGNEGAEVARILFDLATEIEHISDLKRLEKRLKDYNGNTVGAVNLLEGEFNERELLRMALKFYDDVLPQIGKIAIQDHQNMADFATHARPIVLAI